MFSTIPTFLIIHELSRSACFMKVLSFSRWEIYCLTNALSINHPVISIENSWLSYIHPFLPHRSRLVPMNRYKKEIETLKSHAETIIYAKWLKLFDRKLKVK